MTPSLASLPTATAKSTTSARAWAITRAIRAAERRVRARQPWLRFQTAIGLSLVALAYAAVAASTWLWASGVLPALVCVPLHALCFAVLREIEHDLIHDLYLPGKRALQNLVLFAIWPALGNLPSPLFRRWMHLRHHRSSGREEDLEERLVGNGTRYGLVRWIAMLESGLSLPFRQRELRAIPGFSQRRLFLHLLPVVVVFNLCWAAFLLGHAASLAAAACGAAVPDAVVGALAGLDAVAVVWVLPNVLRQASLQVLTSTLHYYGDVEGVVEQTQVLTKWYWLPLQLLTCNFGKSHALHHFVVNQPFYVRELVRREAHAAMREHGVRFDDMGTFGRANRYGTPGL